MTEVRIPVAARPGHLGALGLLLIILLAPVSGWAAIQSPCDTPGVFGGAAANVVLIPYTYTSAQRSTTLSRAAANLSLLIQLDILSAARYGSLGVTRLRGDPGQCRPGEIIERLRNGEVSAEHGRLQTGGGVSVLWGRFFEAGDTLYVQSYLSFFRHDANESIELLLDTPAGNLEFEARLPAYRIAFQPRSVQVSDLEDINRFFSETSTIRQQPDPSAPLVRPEPFDVENFAYGVRSAGEGWLRLIPYGDVPEGYVRLGGKTSQFLKQLLPELALLDAVIGYLTYRAANENPETFGSTAAGIPELLERSSRDYRELVKPREEKLAVSLAHALPAAIQLLDVVYQRTEPAWAADRVRDHLDRAVVLLPDNADLLNLYAISRIVLCCTTITGTGPTKGIEEALQRAMVVNPTHSQVLSTLKSFYRLLLESSGKSGPLTRDELEKRLGAVEKIRVLKQR